jgi:hypothetical protein
MAIIQKITETACRHSLDVGAVGFFDEFFCGAFVILC